MELAVATGTAPAAWIDEPDEIIATAIEVLTEQARPTGKRRR